MFRFRLEEENSFDLQWWLILCSGVSVECREHSTFLPHSLSCVSVGFRSIMLPPLPIGCGNFPALTSNSLYPTAIHLDIFCPRSLSHGFLYLNIISLPRLEPLPMKKQCLILTLHFLQALFQC